MRIVVKVDESGRVDVTGERYSGSHLPVHAVVAAIASAVDTALSRYVASQIAAGGDALTGDSASTSPPVAPIEPLPTELCGDEPPPTTAQLRDRLGELLERYPDLDVTAAAAKLGCSVAKARHLLVEAGAL